MKILVTGSRDWTDRKIIHRALQHLTEDDVLVHGANGKTLVEQDGRRTYLGADLLCEQFALVHSIPTRPYPADWYAHGGCSCPEGAKICFAAGPRRNKRMYDAERPDQVVAFRLYGRSSGTDGMVKLALAGGTPVHVYLAEPRHEDLHQFMPTNWQNYCAKIGRKP